MEREKVVGAGRTVVGRVDAESDLLSADLRRSREMSLIVIEGEACDLHRAD